MGIYKERKEKRIATKKKIELAGIIIASFAALLFVLMCLPLGSFSKFFFGVFGISIYPICLVLVLVGIGMFLSQKYYLQKRYFVYLILNFVFLVCLLHAAIGSSLLKDAEISKFGSYIKNCYSQSPKLTVGGVLFGIVVYPLASFIGTVGTCIVFAILLCIFSGLAVDFMFNKKNKLSRHDFERNRRVIDDVSYDTSFSSLAQDYDTRSEKLVPKKFEKEDIARYEQVKSSSKDESYYSNRLFGEQNDALEEKTEKTEIAETTKTDSFERTSAHDLLFGSSRQSGETSTENTKPEFVRSPEEKYPSKYDPSIFASKKEYITTPILPDYLNYKEIDRKMALDRAKERTKEINQEPSAGFSRDFVPSVSVAEDVEGASSENYVDKQDVDKPKNVDLPSVNSFEQILKSEPSKVEPERVELNESVAVNLPKNDDVDDILPKQTFKITDLISEQSPQFEPRQTKTGRGPDREPRKTPDRLHSFERRLSDMVVEEPKVEQPQRQAEQQFASRVGFGSAPVQASFIQNDKPSFNVAKKTIENTKYVAPDPRLLTTVSDDPNKVSGDVEKRSRVLEETLDSFRIPAKVINVVKGPSVTRYELQVPPGIPVKKLANYDNDIAMTLMSKNGVRLELPIPGKNAAGVEIPNDKPCTVGLRDVIMSREFQSASGALPVAIGKNINGEYVVESLAKMVHLLIAGSTGSGKSVFLHNIILSLMFKSSPEQLRFIMIDPKKVEFNVYNGMPHMMLPNVVTECDKAINSLSWATKEMDRRYRLFNQNLVNDIKSFNVCDAVKRGEEKKLPYIVIVIDELADLMMLAQKDVSKHIQRIAQLGRACGIHLVIATQRPTVQVVTGTIKANLPTRVAFSLTSVIDSQTILDEGGAEKLIGRGDMLYSPQGSAPERLQSAFASMEEVKAVVSFLKEHNASYYDEEVEKEIMAEPVQETAEISEGGKADNVDEFFYPALRLFIETGTASTTMIQRRFGVGFARAARLVDQMEVKGYVSPQNGSKKRNVYITMEQYRELSGDES